MCKNREVHFVTKTRIEKNDSFHWDAGYCVRLIKNTFSCVSAGNFIFSIVGNHNLW